jgi:hypothetical protein
MFWYMRYKDGQGYYRRFPYSGDYVVYLGYINPFSLPIFPVSDLADQTFHTSRLWSDLISKV